MPPGILSPYWYWLVHILLGQLHRIHALGRTGPRNPAPMYVGLLAGSAWSNNEIEDLEGFAHWGMPGYTLDYHDSGLVFGMFWPGTGSWLQACRCALRSTA